MILSGEVHLREESVTEVRMNLRPPSLSSIDWYTHNLGLHEEMLKGHKK